MQGLLLCRACCCCCTGPATAVPGRLLLLLLLLLCRLMGRLPIGCMGRTTAECLHRCFPQSKKQPSYPLVIFTNSVWMPQGKGLEGL